jgi:NADPH:quinone reductase-like Zn-dependent oxidoreductase
MFENRVASGKIGKCAVQLAEHTINFTSCSAIKSQVLADFIADWTLSSPGQD